MTDELKLPTGVATHDMLFEYLEEYARKAEDPSAYTGTYIGQNEFDREVGGIEDGWYVIIGGYEKAGKTTLLMALSKLLAANKKKVAYFSMEMGPAQISPKILASMTGTETIKYRQFKLTEGEWFASNEAVKKTLAWNFDWFIGTNELADILVAITMGDYDVVVIDYIQLMSGKQSGSRGERQQEVQYISRALKSLTLGKKKRIVLAASQYNNSSVRGKIFDNQSLRDSGAMAQDADLVWLMAPAINASGEEVPSMRKILISASRVSDRLNFYIGFKGECSQIDFAQQDLMEFSSPKDLNKIYQEAQRQTLVKGNERWANKDHDTDIPF